MSRDALLFAAVLELYSIWGSTTSLPESDTALTARLGLILALVALVGRLYATSNADG